MVEWKVCSECTGKYLPSITSHEHKCGICAPLKNTRRRYEEVQRARAQREIDDAA